MRDPFWTRTLEQIAAHKITREKFAEYIGVNFDTFRGWVLHNRIPNAYTTCDIADALGVSVEYLVKGKDGAAEEFRMKQMEKRKKVTAKLKNLIAALTRTGDNL